MARIITEFVANGQDSHQLVNNWQDQSWQQQMQGAIRDPLELLRVLDLDNAENRKVLDLHPDFKVLAPLAYVAKMQRGDMQDPLLKQVLALDIENIPQSGFDEDPVGDQAAEVIPGLLKKYHGRALLITTSACAVHCRYCFRRHYPYSDAVPDKQAWQRIESALQADTSIHEVILSGGDPLMLSNQRLQEKVTALAAIPHLQTLRIHTRLPIVLPARIDDDLCALFSQTRLKVVMVIHVNHANEVDDDNADVLQQLTQAGVTLLNQSVLLKGVNDSIDSLKSLSLILFKNNVLPYYIHVLDKVSGAAHFHVTEALACELIEVLRMRLPGYCVPRLVKEVSGKRSKQPLEKISK